MLEFKTSSKNKLKNKTVREKFHVKTDSRKIYNTYKMYNKLQASISQAQIYRYLHNFHGMAHTISCA